MKSICLFFVSLAFSGVFAQYGNPLHTQHYKGAVELLKRGKIHAPQGKVSNPDVLPPISIPQPSFPSTTPQRVGESDKKKQCPNGFEFLGKQCAKTLTTSPAVVCPPGTVLIDERCVKYVGKYSECPAGFVASKGGCVKKITADQETHCPDGFILNGKDNCVRKVKLDDYKVCPAGSTPKGDICVITTTSPPEFVCPTGYTLIGNKCRHEEIFDCTPARPNPPSKEPEHHSKSDHTQQGSRNDLDRTMHGKSDVHRYTLREAAPIVEEYVVQKMCKRVTTEPARRICPAPAFLDGKMCRAEQQVEHIWKTGGYRDDFAPIQRQCPIGFTQISESGICEATEEAPASLHCPGHTVDLGQRCAIYSMSRRECPPGFSLEGKECRKTIFAAPIVEYTVTYTCTGKDCGDTHAQ